MITRDMGNLLLRSMLTTTLMDCPENTDENVAKWLAVIYPAVGNEGLEPYKDNPVVAKFMLAPKPTGLEAACEELYDFYVGKHGHTLAPGIHIAKIKDGVFYGSTQAFPNGEKSRTIISKARESSANAVIERIMDTWRKVAI